MEPNAHLQNDHVDLLITAATSWGVLTTTSSRLLAGHQAAVVDLDPDAAGQALLVANAAAAASTDRRRRRADPERSYRHTPVDRVDVVEVVKATHEATYRCASAPGWAGSEAERLLAGILTAATYRLPGYADAPSTWTRPATRDGDPIAIGGTWRPEISGFDWVDVDEAPAVWGSASLIVVTTEALEQLPTSLEPRTGVFAMDPSGPAPSVWEAPAADRASTLLFWPSCAEWLTQQAQDPDPDYIEYRAS